jgi:hypothetical protein
VTLTALLGPEIFVQADEGMWLPDAPPTKQLADRYKFALTDEYREHAMKASVRFNNGGSGGFVSADGLMVTNHHVGAELIAKVSPKDRDLLKVGFYAKTHEDELKCPDLEVNVLQEIRDVTARVQKAVKPGLSDAESAAARRAVISRIEKETSEKTKLRADVVTLYQGGKYHLYLYKRYTDVRLVFAPEQAAASFGGDVDNFEYPRFNLDVCFFRAYESGKPVKPTHHFRWSEKGPVENDLVIVTGHPGSTNRLDTVAMLRHRRDVTLPYLLAHARFLESMLIQYSARGSAEARMAAKDLARIANRRKVFAGQYQALLDPAIFAAKKKTEDAIRKKATDAADAWKRIEAAHKALAGFHTMYSLLETGDGTDSRLFGVARRLVRLAAEKPKPDAERLPEYSDARRTSFELSLFSPAPIYPELERLQLAGSLSFLAERLGGAHPLVRKILAGKSPAERAVELVNGSKLRDVAERKRLAEGGQKAVDESDDPMIVLARLIDPETRAVRKRHEVEVEEPVRQSQAKVAAARFALLGTDVPPDATFTLRLAFGTVKGYEVDGETLPYATTFGGAFAKADRLENREPFVLPKLWHDRKAKLDLETPFDFVSTADTIGGNSGSPVLDRAGELVGVNFDRNRHGLVRNFVYTDVQARHISVHSRAVLEALRKLYDADGLVKELTAK